MRKVSFDTTFLQLRAAQIRIVDASSGNWGHINVDEIKFNWQIRGGILNDSLVGAVFNGKETAGGNVETPHSGVVYTFLQHVTNSDDICKFDTTICSWRQERKLGASDKRQNTFFGSAIAINDAAGILVVGSPNAAYTGYYKEVQSVYPFLDGNYLRYPLSSSLAPLFQVYLFFHFYIRGQYCFFVGELFLVIVFLFK
jgi:hypothetical protein